MKPSFLHGGEPFITEMVQAKTQKQAELKIRNAIADGATAIGLQMGDLEMEARTEQSLRSIFAAVQNRPIYMTNYRRSVLNKDMSDDELAEGLLFGLKCGATLLDIMGDMFDPTPEELTENDKAIAKQMKLIDEIHEQGGEVLMSSHICKFKDSERVLEVAFEQKRRGADIIKIVTAAETEEEQVKNLETSVMLKKQLGAPFLFLSGGKHNWLHRTVGPAFGSCMWLCFREYDETTYDGPPLLSQVLKIKQGLML